MGDGVTDPALHPRRTPRDVVISYRVTQNEASQINAAIEAMAVKWRRRSDWCRAAALHAAKARAPDPAPVHRLPRRLPTHDVQLLGQIFGRLGALTDGLRDAGTANPEALHRAETEIRSIGDTVRRALTGGHHDHQGE